jgi:hypothetical protein
VGDVADIDRNRWTGHKCGGNISARNQHIKSGFLQRVINTIQTGNEMLK